MKNYVKLFFVCVICSVVFISMSVVANLKDHQKSLFLGNIEAMAANEESYIHFYNYGTLDCPTNHVKVQHIIELD